MANEGIESPPHYDDQYVYCYSHLNGTPAIHVNTQLTRLKELLDAELYEVVQNIDHEMKELDESYQSAKHELTCRRQIVIDDRIFDFGNYLETTLTTRSHPAIHPPSENSWTRYLYTLFKHALG